MKKGQLEKERLQGLLFREKGVLVTSCGYQVSWRNPFRLLLWFALRGKGRFLVHYKMMQVFLSLNGFSEVGMPISRGSLRACSSQYDIRSADAFETFILSMEASNLSCCTVLLAWAMLLVLAVLLDIFDESSFWKSARLCVAQCLQVLNGGVNLKEN